MTIIQNQSNVIMTLNRKGLNATLPDYQRLKKERVASVTLVEVARKEGASVTEKKITNDNDWSLKVATSNATTGVNKSNYILLLL